MGETLSPDVDSQGQVDMDSSHLSGWSSAVENLWPWSETNRTFQRMMGEVADAPGERVKFRNADLERDAFIDRVLAKLDRAIKGRWADVDFPEEEPEENKIMMAAMRVIRELRKDVVELDPIEIDPRDVIHHLRGREKDALKDKVIEWIGLNGREWGAVLPMGRRR
jgi:hypothetical protein